MHQQYRIWAGRHAEPPERLGGKQRVAWRKPVQLGRPGGTHVGIAHRRPQDDVRVGTARADEFADPIQHVGLRPRIGVKVAEEAHMAAVALAHHRSPQAPRHPEKQTVAADLLWIRCAQIAGHDDR